MSLNAALKIETTSKMAPKLSEFSGEKKKRQSRELDRRNGVNWEPGSRKRRFKINHVWWTMHVSILSVTHTLSFSVSLHKIPLSPSLVFFGFSWAQFSFPLPHLCQPVTVWALCSDFMLCCLHELRICVQTQTHTVLKRWRIKPFDLLMWWWKK